MSTASGSVTPRVRSNPNSEYAELSQRIKAAGLLERRYGYYLAKFSLLAFMFIGAWVAFFFLGNTWYQLIIAGFLAIASTQMAFLAHDAAHRQMFNSGKLNDWAALLITNLFSGLSSGWWVRKHTKHHAAPNQKEKDPDIGPGPLAFTPEVAEEKGKVGRFLANYQGWFFFPLLFLEGLNLHFQSIKMLVSPGPVKKRWIELTFILIRLSTAVALPIIFLSPGLAAAFIGVQFGIFGAYLGASFAPNHIGMPLVPKELKVDFLRRQVLMSRNITGGTLMSIAMGGLNYQIEHHLFPSMPRPNLRRARVIVKEFCKEKKVSYTETTVIGAYKVIIRYLNQVGLANQDPFQCPLVVTYRPRG